MCKKFNPLQEFLLTIKQFKELLLCSGIRSLRHEMCDTKKSTKQISYTEDTTQEKVEDYIITDVEETLYRIQYQGSVIVTTPT